MNRHKVMRIPDGVCQTNKRLFMTVNPNNARKLGFADHPWLPFLDQPQSDVVIFEIIYFRIYRIFITEYKHGIFPIDIIIFNKALVNVSSAVIELTNND